jgi:hypothetical protein
MPNPKEFDNQKDWMDACMHQRKTVEKKDEDQDQSVAICLNMWRDKDKKSARKIVASFLEAIDKESGVWIDPKKTPRLIERGLQRERGEGPHALPSKETREPKPKEGDQKEFFENGKWVMKNYEHGKWTEIKEPVHG